VKDEQQQRIVRAKVAIEAYAERSGGGSFEEVFSDLLADLMHYVDALRQDREFDDLDTTFDDLLGTARMNYTAEVEENNE
jgi:hypothetical protein